MSLQTKKTTVWLFTTKKVVFRFDFNKSFWENQRIKLPFLLYQNLPIL